MGQRPQTLTVEVVPRVVGDSGSLNWLGSRTCDKIGFRQIDLSPIIEEQTVRLGVPRHLAILHLIFTAVIFN